MPVKKKETLDENLEKPRSEDNKFWKNKYVLVSLIIAIFGSLYLLKGFFIAAVVNGRPIFRYSVVRELEKQQGKNALDTLITESLINQEAQKKGIIVLPKDVNDEIDKISEDLKSQNQDLDQALIAQNMTREDLAKQIRLRKIIEQLLSDKVEVKDEEIADYIKNYGSSFANDLSDEEKKAQAKDQLTQQKLSDAFYTWIQDLKNNSKINYFVNY